MRCRGFGGFRGSENIRKRGVIGFGKVSREPSHESSFISDGHPTDATRMRAGWSNPSKPPNPPSGPHHLLLGSPGRRWGTLGGMDTNTRPLTARQREVLDLWLAGTPYKELAARLGISPETVNPHLKGIAKKLDAGGISREALRRAVYAPRR